MSTYYDVRANLWGEDRDEAVKAMEDDDKFDRWMAEYDRKQKLKSAAAKSGSKGGTRISQADYLRNHAKVHGDG